MVRSTAPSSSQRRAVSGKRSNVRNGSAEPLTAASLGVTPFWSPDGRYIAFIRDGPSSDRAAYYLIPALGGAERKIGEAYDRSQVSGRCIDWSLDGPDEFAAVRVWAVRTLGPLFCTVVVIQDDHQLITSGPYRLSEGLPGE